MRWILLIAVFGAALGFSGASIAASKDHDLGAFRDWHAYAYEEGGQTVCYMVTTKIPPPGSKKKTPSYLMVTHRPIEGSTDVFSYGAGVELDSKHGAQLTLGNETFDLFSVKDTAWAREALTDHKIAKALRGNSAAQIFALSAKGRGVTVKESFSLAGAGDAYRTINKACGMPDMETRPSVKKAPATNPTTKAVAKKSVPKAAAKVGSVAKSASKAASVKKVAAPKKASKTAKKPAKPGTVSAKKVPKTSR